MGKYTATALQYNRKLPAPLVLANGYGEVARRITHSAQSANVPIIKNKALSAQLSGLDIGQLIPESCYEVVAQLLSFVYSVSQTKGPT